MTLTNASSSSQFGSQACRSARRAIVDDGAVVFDSNAILLYLAEKTGKFLPENTPKARGELLSWLMFVASGVGRPYAGQSVHFNAYAPEKLPYAINRYAFEAQRDFKILKDRLAKQKSMLGDVYTRSKTLAGAALKQLCR